MPSSHTIITAKDIKRNLPRKIPIRVEPKSFYSNERTFISWMKMAIALAGVSTALVGLRAYGTGEAEAGTDFSVTKSTTIVSGFTISMIYILMSPLAALMVIYATIVYKVRRKCLKTKEVTYFFNDQYGPMTIAIAVITVLLVIFCLAIRDIIHA